MTPDALFEDRIDAGTRLAERLAGWRGRDAVVVALPRGGVPVAAEIARAIAAPLDLVLVRKIGAPFQPELAVGAVVDGEEPELVLNEDVVAAVHLPEGYLDAERERHVAEIERRRRVYFAGRERPSLKGRPVILVDDGVATGATARVAVHALRRKMPSRLVLAVPVAAPDTAAALAREVDELVCLATPEHFFAISQFYADFPQTSDEEVTALLAGQSPAAVKPDQG
jgi:putative phosphoribosyl transferase